MVAAENQTGALRPLLRQVSVVILITVLLAFGAFHWGRGHGASDELNRMIHERAAAHQARLAAMEEDPAVFNRIITDILRDAIAEDMGSDAAAARLEVLGAKSLSAEADDMQGLLRWEYVHESGPQEVPLHVWEYHGLYHGPDQDGQQVTLDWTVRVQLAYMLATYVHVADMVLGDHTFPSSRRGVVLR